MGSLEKQLEDDLKIIFGAKKITYEQPSDLKEQECIFIEMEEPKTSFRDKKIHIVVSGRGSMFGNSEKLTIGYFAKCIERMSKELSKRFHFRNVDANTKYFGNLVQRDFSFVYFFDDQYDPDTGTMTSIQLTLNEE